jgi:hypothetical protein
MMQYEYVDKLLYPFCTLCLLRICPIMSDVNLGRGIGWNRVDQMLDTQSFLGQVKGFVISDHGR